MLMPKPSSMICGFTPERKSQPCGSQGGPTPGSVSGSRTPKTNRASRPGGSEALDPVMSSLALASRQADLDPPRRLFGVFLLAHEVDLGRADVGMAGELADLVHRSSVPDGVV